MPPLNEDEQRWLLRLARQAVREAVCFGRLLDPPLVPLPRLKERLGAFVTLHRGHELRGCIGQTEGQEPLHVTVCECARAAALRDPRFNPVTPEEIPTLTLEISVLSPLETIDPERIAVGQHGLMVARGLRRGLLLPQVATEWKWDRQRFLEETCRKAGLPRDAWKHDAKVYAFTAQVFSEREHGGSPAQGIADVSPIAGTPENRRE